MCSAFTYASGAYGGHISDPQIVGSSDWLGLVGGFDVILADKGFLINKGQISADMLRLALFQLARSLSSVSILSID